MLRLNPSCANWFWIKKAHDLCPEIARLKEGCKANEVKELGSLWVLW